MPENNYIQCPKCQKKYHVKAGKCPICNITTNEYAQEQAIVKKKAAKKAQAKADRDLSKQYYCTACGSVFRYPKKMTRGNILIEIILWLFLLIPGLIYTIWRLSTKYKVCPSCKAPTIIPANSPIAQKALSNN